MASLLAQVRLPYISGLPEDVSINSFSFLTADVSDTTLAAIRTRLLNFYNATSSGQTTAISAMLSSAISRSAGRIKIYNRADALPRAPISDEPFALEWGASGSPLPEEVALCLSFRGPLASGVPAARRRGRVYIGPLEQSAVASDSTGRVRPAVTLRDALVVSGKRLMDATDAQVDWVVHSTMTASGSPDTTVVHCWVDDAFDTQRRRGASPVSRVVRNRSDQLP